MTNYYDKQNKLLEETNKILALQGLSLKIRKSKSARQIKKYEHEMEAIKNGKKAICD